MNGVKGSYENGFYKLVLFFKSYLYKMSQTALISVQIVHNVRFMQYKSKKWAKLHELPLNRQEY